MFSKKMFVVILIIIAAIIGGCFKQKNQDVYDKGKRESIINSVCTFWFLYSDLNTLQV